MLKKVFVAIALAIGIATFAGTPAQAFLDKTRFVAHLGVAYFCFHHWVLKPYEHGDFAGGAPHRTSSIVKAGAALLFAVHEVHVSQKIAQNSNDPLLKKLDSGLNDLTSSFTAIGQNFKQGKFDPADVAKLKTQTGSVSDEAAQNGATIKDVPAAIPGT